MSSPYIAITDTDRAEMLKHIGVESVEELFADVPEALRFPLLNLPDPLSEPALMREIQDMGAMNATAQTHRLFLGAGAYHHFVPSAVDQILRRSEFYTPTRPTNQR